MSRKSETGDPAADALLAVADAAVMWWVGKRPVLMSIEQHRAHPTINCATDSECRLARAVAAWNEVRVVAKRKEGKP